MQHVAYVNITKSDLPDHFNLAVDIKHGDAISKLDTGRTEMIVLRKERVIGELQAYENLGYTLKSQAPESSKLITLELMSQTKEKMFSSPISTNDILGALVSGKFRPMTDGDLEAMAGIEFDGFIWDDCEEDCIVILDRSPETIYVQVTSTLPDTGGTWVMELNPDRSEPEMI